MDTVSKTLRVTVLLFAYGRVMLCTISAGINLDYVS